MIGMRERALFFTIYFYAAYIFFKTMYILFKQTLVFKKEGKKLFLF
jgi:hypothetical protein